ncbi:MAG: hypothetical protein JNM65_05270 [Verrucomicrobiaceae bacterium]|nr:hypothetical protein [Verrucomicrobiaceae bacterium]
MFKPLSPKIAQSSAGSTQPWLKKPGTLAPGFYGCLGWPVRSMFAAGFFFGTAGVRFGAATGMFLETEGAFAAGTTAQGKRRGGEEKGGEHFHDGGVVWIAEAATGAPREQTWEDTRRRIFQAISKSGAKKPGGNASGLHERTKSLWERISLS